MEVLMGLLQCPVRPYFTAVAPCHKRDFPTWILGTFNHSLVLQNLVLMCCIIDCLPKAVPLLDAMIWLNHHVNEMKPKGWYLAILLLVWARFNFTISKTFLFPFFFFVFVLKGKWLLRSELQFRPLVFETESPSLCSSGEPQTCELPSAGIIGVSLLVWNICTLNTISFICGILYHIALICIPVVQNCLKYLAKLSVAYRDCLHPWGGFAQPRHSAQRSLPKTSVAKAWTCDIFLSPKVCGSVYCTDNGQPHNDLLAIVALSGMALRNLLHTSSPPSCLIIPSLAKLSLL